MADDARTPVAIRLSRPYRTDDEFLDRELETLTRTSVTLLGAQSRPQGVVLRFELTLATGEPLIRGEGRVVGFKPATPDSESGLTLRFTRLDARSKTLIDRAAAVRDARARGATPPPPAVAAKPDPSAAASSDREEPVPSSRVMSPPEPPAPPRQPARQPPPLPRRATPAPFAAARPTPAPAGSARAPLSAPANRDDILARLRDRAKGLTPDAVASILAKRAER